MPEFKAGDRVWCTIPLSAGGYGTVAGVHEEDGSVWYDVTFSFGTCPVLPQYLRPASEGPTQ